MNVFVNVLPRKLVVILTMLVGAFCTALASAQEFDLAGNARLPPETLPGQSATMLPDGRWLLLGGEEEGGVSATATLVDLRKSSIENAVLTARLTHARAWHSATLLPDGNVFVFGGVNAVGKLIDQVESFDPKTQTFQVLTGVELNPRAHHTSTLLTDGRLLIAGGKAKGNGALYGAELWNFKTRKREDLKPQMEIARFDHHSLLLSSEPVLLWGGKNRQGETVPQAEFYNPARQRFDIVDAENQKSLLAYPYADTEPNVEATNPAHNARHVSVDSFFAVRFSKYLRVETLNRDTVTLIGPLGKENAKVVPAEGGMLLFVTPTAQMLPGSSYSLFINGATDDLGRVLPFTAITVTTQEFTAAGVENISTPASSTMEVQQAKKTETNDEEWIPDELNRKGNWRHNGNKSPYQNLPPLQANIGVTALAGQVLLVNGKPLKNVALTVDGKTATTDETGRFLLTDISVGRQELYIDGRSASKPSTTYGEFVVGVSVMAARTNVLPYTIWMSRIDTENATTISSPATKDIVVTTPRIPGMEIHIPKGTVIRDRDGKIVTRISVTAIPVDRTPFPVPNTFPIYFTIQPGGAVIQGIGSSSSPGVRIVYPNYTNDRPGTARNFWMYDSRERGWFVYGSAHVSADGLQVIPDPGVGLQRQMEVGHTLPPGREPPSNPVPPDGCRSGDPVDCRTGVFLHERTDVELPDTMPLRFTRTYRTQNTPDTVSRAFGIGTTHNYEMYLRGDTSYFELVLPDGARISLPFLSGTDLHTDAIWEHTSTPTRFYRARLTAVVDPVTIAGLVYYVEIYRLTLTDGTVYEFGGYTGLLDRVIDRNGNRIEITRDGSDLNWNLITRITTSNGRYIDFTYDTSARITQIKDLLGRAWVYTYNANGYLAKATYPDSSFEEYTYDTSGRMLTVRDQRGNIMVSNVYYAGGGGQVAKQTLADGGVYTFTYAGVELVYTVVCGNICGEIVNGVTKVRTDVTDPRGFVRRYTFDQFGYPYSITDALGTPLEKSRFFERDSSGHLTWINETAVDAGAVARRTKFTYDANGNVTSITRMADTAEAVTETFTYESRFNQIASFTDALNHTTTFTYDSNGNLIAARDPLGNTATGSYSASGQLISLTNPLNQTTQFAYEGSDLVKLTDPLGRVSTRYADVIGRTASVTNPLGNLTRFSYDSSNRLTKFVDTLGGATNLTYDADGNRLSLTDPKGAKTSFTYDGRNRVASRVDPALRADALVYDGNGNVIQRTDRKGKITTFTYDALNRLTKADYGKATPTGTPDATVTYTYDLGNRLTQLVDSQGGTITWSYDSFDRVLTETTAQGKVTYTYDAAGRRISMTVLGQATVNYGYDNANRLTQVSQGAATTSIAYDAAGRRSAVTLPSGVTENYAYDAASQLTGITYKKGAATLGALTYEYNAAGQRTQVAGTYARATLPTALTSATYNALNQLTAWGTTAFTYDTNGNMLTEGVKTFTWDSRDRLTALTSPASTSFKYDALARRTKKTISGTATDFLYDGVNPVQELSGVTPTANLLTGLGFDEYFRRTDSAGARDFVSDGVNSTLALFDANGATQTQYTYEPFGKQSSSGQSSGNSYTFTGRESDGATNLMFYRARYYNPTYQRFISQDPIGLRGGLNTYAYVQNNPINLIDPLGLMGSGPGQSGCGENGWGPDFINFQVDLYIGSVWGTFSRSGNSFFGLGVNKGIANPASAGAHISAGWLNSSSVTPGQVDSFLSGYAGSGAAVYSGLGGGFAWSPGNGTATVVGIGAGYTAGGVQNVGSVAGGYSWNQGQTGLSW